MSYSVLGEYQPECFYTEEGCPPPPPPRPARRASARSMRRAPVRAIFGLGARPTWCPTTTFNAENPPKDPCEITYSVDLPIVGRTDMSLPIDQMTNDAIYGAERQLPQTLQRVMPMVQPYIDTILGEAQVFAQDALDNALQTQVLPELERQKQDVFAHADALASEALKTLVVVGATVALAIGFGVWWLKKA